ncbi:hypothetical protein FRC01_006357 [Tulasnella sp. 417]|nr:hypothetical protein FRC01_006357 [Tulasnella sp. 417]
MRHDCEYGILALTDHPNANFPSSATSTTLNVGSARMPMPSLASRYFCDCYGLGTTDSCVGSVLRVAKCGRPKIIATERVIPTGLVVPSMTSPMRLSRYRSLQKHYVLYSVNEGGR